MTARATDRRARALDSVARAAVRQLGLGDPRELILLRDGENLMYRVSFDQGAPIALRLHRPGYHSRAAIASELAWMGALRAAGVATPQVLAASDGIGVLDARDDDGRNHRLCVAFEWVAGRQLESSDHERTFPLVGELMAELHRQSESWNPPPGFERPAWDASALVGDTPRWGAFEHASAWREGDLAVLHEARDVVRERLDSVGTGNYVFGLVHADLTPTNVLVSNNRPVVIDFDDCGPSWLAYDAAVALWEFQGDTRFEALRRGLLEGYRRGAGRPLPGHEELPTFFMARSLALLGWLHTRAESAHAAATWHRRTSAAVPAAMAYLRWAGRATRRTVSSTR